MSSRIFRLGLITAAIMTMCFAGVSFLSAQEFRATITGQVSDPSGRAIPGATVTAVQKNTNETFTAKCNGAGIYSIDFVLPGQFTVTIKATGFSKKVYPNVTLQAAQKLTLNVTLSVGSIRQEVTVTAKPGLLNTTTSSGGGVVDQTKIENFATTGRSPWVDVMLAQGVQWEKLTPPAAAVMSPNQAVNVNGSPGSTNSFYVNGAPASIKGTNYYPLADAAVQELQVSESGGAQDGPGAGGVFSAVIKQGTNRFHGNLYDYLQNKVFNSQYSAANLTGQKKPANTRNIFGGTLGGPIQKGKTFFFFSYQGGRQNNPAPGIASVPTAAMRNGDFSATGYTIYDPSTVTCVNMTASGCSTYGRTAFPNDIIPQSDISPIGAAITNLYPAPNLPSVDGLSDYAYSGQRGQSYNQYIGRVDHVLSPSTRLYDVITEEGNYVYSPGNGLPSGLVGTTIGNTNGYFVSDILDLTHTFSTSLVADVKLSFLRNTSSAISGIALQKNYSVPGLTMPFIPTTTQQNIAPHVGVSGYAALLGNTDHGSATTDWFISPSVVQMKGRHNLHYGVEFKDTHYGGLGVPGSPNGSFSFSNNWTRENPLKNAAGSGNALADLLLGYPTSGSVAWDVNPYNTWHYYAAYLQDRYKVRKNLTLNVGLRWSTNTSISERYNRLNGPFCFTCTNPYSSQMNYSLYPNLPNPLTGGLTFAGVTAPHGPFNVGLNHWQPRLGIAWAMTPKTVLRAGWGIYYRDPIPRTEMTGFSQTTSYVESLNGNVDPVNDFRAGSPYPNGVLVPAGASGGFETSAGNGVSYVGSNSSLLWTQHWSVGFQRTLPKRILLDVEYVGSHTHGYNVSQPWNVISPPEQAVCYQDNAICNARVSNPFYGVLPAASALGASTTLAAWQLMRPYPLFNGVTETNDPLAYINYNALQVRAERQVRSLDFVVNYVYSNQMAATSYLNAGNFRDATLWYGPQASTSRHYIAGNMNWPLPVGQGGMLLPKAHGLLGGLINHWEMVSTVVYFTGYPLNISNANLVGGPGCTSYAPVGGQTSAHWFNNNESCYQRLNQWQARTTPLRVGYLRSPFNVSWEGALEKSFTLPFEGMSLRFRAECINCSNTPIFGEPNTNVAAVPRLHPQTGWSGFGTLSHSQANWDRVFEMSMKLSF